MRHQSLSKKDQLIMYDTYVMYIDEWETKKARNLKCK